MRRGRLLCLLLLLALAAAAAAADALQDIDNAVSELGKFVLQTIPDEAGLSLTILPFLSDVQGRVTLGDRLGSELELYLASEFRRVRIIPQPEPSRTFAVTGELQSYPGRVRVICRITRPDGSLGGGTRLDIPSSPELLALLEPSAVMPSDAPAEPMEQEAADVFEPDDAPGFEVQVPSFGTHSFGRSISPGDVDRFRFFKSDGGTVVLEAQTQIDLQLLLFREGENIPFEVRGSEGSASVRLEISLEEGYYVAEVLAYDFSVQGSYVFTVDLSGLSNDGFEPDNRFSEAQAIYPDTRQDRALLSGDRDWVELSFTVPAFYAIYTQGEADTQIGLFADEQREVLQDDDSGSGSNAFIPLFLGTRRTYARVESGGQGGAYTLVFETIDPQQIFPSSGVRRIQAGDTPQAFQLRIIQADRYVIRATVAAEVYSLPAMRRVRGVDSLYSLSAGDYLFILKSDRRQSVGYCIAPEASGDPCLQLREE